MDSTHVAGTVFELLAERARTVGPKPAVLAPNHPPLTYGMLHEQALQAGDEFARLGLGPGSRIAVALLDERDAAVAMLATMSWVTCVPLSVGSGAAGQEERLRQLRVDAVMVAEGDDGPLAAAARAAGLALIKVATAIDGGIELLAPCPDRAPGSTASQGRPDDVALLLQTSGTTGRSRAIPITHRALLCAGAGRSISAADRVMCVVPMHTSSGLRAGVIAPLAIGASTVIASGFDASRFFAWLDAFHPTAVLASPTVHSAILEEALQRKRALPGSVRFVRSSSNAMSAAMQERIEAVLGVPVIQGYGMTETGLISEDAPPPGRRRAGSVGVPRNVEIRIVDERGESAIAGGVGEILVRGPAVTQGYEDDPEANSSAFRDGWFRTGDLGCLDPDGYLFIVGRCKELINRGGLKVAPAEVDGVLLRHPDVLDAATVAVPHPSLGEDVVTAVVLRDGAATAPAQLRAYASERLEPFKVPSAIVPVDELPRNALGKVRRAALAELVAKAMSTVHVPPRDAEERLVAGIFSCILHRPRVGALDNFFELGGDSLRAAQVFARVSEQAGVTMKPSTLFEAPTVEQLAQEVRKALACPMRSSASAPPLVRRAHRGVDATRGERGRSPTGVALD